LHSLEIYSINAQTFAIKIDQRSSNRSTGMSIKPVNWHVDHTGQPAYRSNRSTGM